MPASRYFLVILSENNLLDSVKQLPIILLYTPQIICYEKVLPMKEAKKKKKKRKEKKEATSQKVLHSSPNMSETKYEQEDKDSFLRPSSCFPFLCFQSLYIL